MNEDLLVICIPSKREDEKVSSDIELDFLFESENYKTVSIDSTSQLEIFKDDIFDVDCYKIDKKIYYHIDHVKHYLEKNFKKLSKELKLERFVPDNQFVLYELLAKNGIVIYFNSVYISFLFLPEKLKENQRKGLIAISDMVDPNMTFSCSRIGDILVEGLNYKEVLSYLELDSDRKIL